jgi:hypothetical protein
MRARGALSTGRQVLMVPRLASMMVQMPRWMKLYVWSVLFLREFWTDVTRIMDVMVTLERVSQVQSLTVM